MGVIGCECDRLATPAPFIPRLACSDRHKMMRVAETPSTIRIVCIFIEDSRIAAWPCALFKNTEHSIGQWK